MKTIIQLFLFFAAVASASASAAVTCVINKETGKFESKDVAGSDKKKTVCDPTTADATLRDVQQAINDAGSKLVSPTVLTNADKIAVPAPVAEVKESESEMQIPGKELPKKNWNVMLADKSVRMLLDRWCREEGYQLLWEVSVDLEIGANATLSGSFEDALNAVLASLSTSNYPIEAMIYDNRVVRVVKHTPRNP